MSVIAGKLVRMDRVVRMCRSGQRRKCQYNIRVQMIDIIVRKWWTSKKPTTKVYRERGEISSECGNIVRNNRVDQEIMVGIVEDRTS